MKGKKTGGRQIGSQNKTTKEVRQSLSAIIDQVDILADLKKLDPLKRLELVVKLLPFVIPRYRDEIVQGEGEGIESKPIQVTVFHRNFD